MNRLHMPYQRAACECRILVVHGQAQVRTDLCKLLTAARPGWGLGQAANARETLTLLESGAWDLVLVDLWLSDTAGWGLCGHIRATWPQTTVVVIGDAEGSLYAKASAFAGAAGYVCRRRLPEQLDAVLQSSL